ncbi:vomeronasal type-1 receptor 90-like [Lepus europaeus]|uniref:vomeronasal type-1 receptor 90-like n=1 Tax=Lepus europaeus TaxID=9983 RepID=UPI002B46A77B|nr:vomeronasal type-1 receptor 90-like [Lepus europaeus]
MEEGEMPLVIASPGANSSIHTLGEESRNKADQLVRKLHRVFQVTRVKNIITIKTSSTISIETIMCQNYFCVWYIRSIFIHTGISSIQATLLSRVQRYCSIRPKMNKNNKLSSVINIRYIFFSEVSVGMSANAFLLLFYLFQFFYKHRPKSTDLPIGLLAPVHLTMLLIMGFMATDMFVSRGFWDDITCQSFIYIYRLMRVLSLCTTCLLSISQAITLSPSSSCLAKFKLYLAPHQQLCSLLSLWVFSMFFSAHYSYSAVHFSNVSSGSLLFLSESCTIVPMGYYVWQLFSILGIFRDASLLGLMALSSGYMVILLCRHKRRSQHLHSTSLSPRASPEQRATRTILLLMSVFVFMYLLECTVSSSRVMWNNDPVFRCVQMMVANGFATISPLLLISTEKRIIDFFESIQGKKTRIKLFSIG